MKQFILILLLPLMIRAQDTIVMKNDSVILSLVLNVSAEKTTYKKIADLTGPERFIYNSTIKYITYKHGKKQVMDSLGKLGHNSYDLLELKNEAPKKVLVKEITPDWVKYKSFDNQDGPLYSVNKSQVKQIVYANGFKENIDSLYKPRQGTETVAARGDYNPNYGIDMYRKGTQDAIIYYKRHGAGIGVGIASLIGGIFGLIPAVICSATPPKVHKLDYPSFQLWKNPDYQKGYKYKARKLKQKRVWIGFGIGLISGSVITVLLNQ